MPRRSGTQGWTRLPPLPLQSSGRLTALPPFALMFPWFSAPLYPVVSLAPSHRWTSSQSVLFWPLLQNAVGDCDAHWAGGWCTKVHVVVYLLSSWCFCVVFLAACAAWDFLVLLQLFLNLSVSNFAPSKLRLSLILPLPLFTTLRCDSIGGL